MSDATLPTLPSSSPEADLRSTNPSVPNLSESDIYPFLVHSQQSIVNGEPPEVDNGKLARQKRKRTSPEDQATLEAEYKRNPKPDKAARVEILKKVSLGEKEVQIWFQNRRQNTRRKSRPLLPHEIVAFGLGGMVTLSSAPILGIAHGVGAGSGLPVSTYALKRSDGGQEPCQSSDDSQEPQRVPVSPILRENLEQTNNDPDTSSCSTKPINILTDPNSGTYSQSSRRYNVSPSLTSSERISTTLGYLSNRRNARASSLGTLSPSAIPLWAEGSTSKQSPPSSCPGKISSEKLSRPPSQVRLSLSLDGKAELISSQVSPPRPQLTQALSSTSNANHAPPGLKRCQSDVPSRQVPRKSSLCQMPLISRISSGRSRDARTWEFCCDTEARDELTTQAENESNGSAVAAISLLRSTSTSNMKPSGSKRNVPAPKAVSVAHGKKTKLGRASSSVARLQGSGKALLGSPSADSDKENWLPEDGNGNVQRRNLALPRSQKQKRRRVLEESKTGLTQASVLSGREMDQGKPSSTEVDIFENSMIEPKVDREVDRFMRGEVSPSKKGDLDCIQGLLSLSQGTWR